MLPPLLFLIAIDWIMRENTKDQERGIRWRLHRKLEDLDYADDLCLILSTHKHTREKTKLHDTARSLGLNTNRKKTKVSKINAQINNTIQANGENLEEVETFTYLRSIVATSGGTDEDVTSKINKACNIFEVLKPV